MCVEPLLVLEERAELQLNLQMMISFVLHQQQARDTVFRHSFEETVEDNCKQGMPCFATDSVPFEETIEDNCKQGIQHPRDRR
jgi:hypothetical protein